MKYTLRKALPSDKSRIEALFIEMLQTIYQKPDVNGYDEGDLDKFFGNTGDWVCVAEAEGQIVAFLSIEEHHTPTDYLYLDDFCVAKDYRGHGIGTDLLKTAEQYATDRKIPQILLHVEKSNSAAHRLYERLGFQDDADAGSRIRMKKGISLNIQLDQRF